MSTPTSSSGNLPITMGTCSHVMAEGKRKSLSVLTRRDPGIHLLHELPHPIHEGLPVVDVHQGPRHAHRVAEKEALVKDLALPEGAPGHVPSQAEDPDAGVRVHVAALEVFVDIGADRSD